MWYNGVLKQGDDTELRGWLSTQTGPVCPECFETDRLNYFTNGVWSTSAPDPAAVERIQCASCGYEGLANAFVGWYDTSRLEEGVYYAE